MRRQALAVGLLAAMLGGSPASAGATAGRLVPAGWAPGGIPPAPLSERSTGDVGAARQCAENAVLLVRVGESPDWSVAAGDLLVTKGWSAYDLEIPITIGRPRPAAVRRRLARAVAQCDERTVLVAVDQIRAPTVRRAIEQLDAPTRARIARVDEVAHGATAAERAGRATARSLRTWPRVTIDEALAGVPQAGIRLGRRDAPVVVQVFADLQCPFCASFSADHLPRLVARYVTTGEVQLRAQLVGFIGTDSERLAQMAVAAGLQHRLWTFVARALERQRRENTGYVTDVFLRRVGAIVPGLDVERAMRDRGRRQTSRLLRGAQRLWTHSGQVACRRS